MLKPPEASKVAAEGMEASAAWRQRLVRVQAFVIENYLPIAFAVALLIAMAWPVPGRYLQGITVAGNVRIVQDVAIGLVFFISGLALNTTELRRAMQRDSVVCILYGFVMILGVSPLLGFAMREIPLTPPAFTMGLTISCLVPTTLGVGVALVRSCRGNEAVGLLLTVATNMLGVFTMPPYLRLLFSGYDTRGLRMNVDITDLLIKLSITILAPSVAGKVLRELCKPAERFAQRQRSRLSLFSTTCLAFIIWQTLSGARDLLFRQSASSIVVVIALGSSIHIFYLFVNHWVVKLVFRAPLAEAVAVIVMASQKSAPVAVTLIIAATSDPSQQGLLAIPCIVGQLCQIFIAASLAKYYAPQVTKAREAAEAAVALQATAEAGPGDTPASAPASPAPRESDGGTLDVPVTSISMVPLAAISQPVAGAEAPQGTVRQRGREGDSHLTVTVHPSALPSGS